MHSIKLPILGLSIVSTACLLLFVALTWNLRSDTKRSFELTTHSGYVLEQARLLETALDNAGSAERRYVLGGTSDANDSFVAASDRVERLAAQMPDVVRDNLSQEPLTLPLATDAINEIRDMAASMALMESVKGRGRAFSRQEIGAMAALRGESEQATFDADFSHFLDEETRLQNQRQSITEGLLLQSAIFLALGALVAIAITLFLNLTIGRYIVSRLMLLKSQASSFAGTQLVVAPMRGRDEVAEVSRTIHEMAVQIKERSDGLIRYRLLAEQALDSIMFFRTPDGRIIEANRAAIRAYGYSLSELLEMTGFDLLAPDKVAFYREMASTETFFNMSVETEHRRKDGSVFPVLVSMRTAQMNDEEIMMVIIRDLTERDDALKLVRAAADQALEASRLKSEFVATMSHEIRTPMNGVVGMTELLLETPLTREQHDFATTAMESAHSLLGVINNILDFSKIEAGRVDLELVEFDLLHMIESIGALFSTQAHIKQIGFVTFVDPMLRNHLLGDPTRLRQVMTNLVGNAVKFTAHGCVALSADVTSCTDNTARVRFSVKDTGIGIAAEKVPTLFEAFRQADGSTTREYGGTGLGLSISRNLVELMGGEIAVETTPNKGSTFSFTLDFSIGSAVAGLPVRPNLAGIHALVVDDDALSRDIVSRYATSWGVHVSTARHAAEALAILQSAAEGDQPYDIAIVDLRMPEIDGMQLAERIRSNPLLRGTRLVLVTAYDGPAQGQAAIAAGFSAYLTKPVRQSQLYDCISGALSALVDGPAPGASPETIVERHDRILLAEDNAINRRVALQQLRKLGYSADSVTNGKEAVEQSRKVEYGLIFMDCHMPLMDGFEATKAIRSRESWTGKHVAIVAMTANALRRDRDACLAAGMDEYLTKPVGLEAMQAVTNRWLGKPDENTILDRGRIEDIFGDDRPAMAEFLGGVIPSIGAICDNTARSTDLPCLRELAHELKGAAGNIGARELASAAVALEAGLRDATDCIDLRLPLLDVANAWARLHHLAEHPDAIFGASR